MSIKKETDVVLTFENIDITKADLRRLEPATFLNDNIINFYLKYMYRCMLNDNHRQRVHIFDSFFCEALEEMHEERVIRWLRGVNIFEKEYIVIPAMIDEHWFLVIIRNAGAILTSIANTGSLSSSSRNSYRNHRNGPCIIIMDSLPNHTREKKPQLIQHVYDFIQMACSVKGKNVVARNLRELMPNREFDVKIQSNDYDCGLHLLANAEQFFIDKLRISPEAESETEFRLTQARQRRKALRKFIDRLIEQYEIEKSVMNGTVA